jgi:hypothetical protein
MKRHAALLLCAIALLIPSAVLAEGGWSWQKPQANVAPNGDLSWAPKAFEFAAGREVRYIDFDGGDDDNPGDRKDRPWKHHPWDKNATGQAARASGAITYVFKRGVVYRGFLSADDSGTADEPVRLTSDPSWGEGEAIIAGSMPVTEGWKRATPADVPEGMPEAGKVWYLDIGTDFEPWACWQVAGDGKVTRIHMARNPNWTLTNPADPKDDWAEWTWPSKEHERAIGTRAGVDEALKGKPEDFFDGVYCWTEWGGGIWGAMSLQYRSPVTQYDPQKGSVDRVVISPLFDGWVVAGDRYFMEKHPSYLDSPGEYYYEAPSRWYPANLKFPWEGSWLPTRAKHTGRLYVRLPGDRNPNGFRIELGRRDQAIRILDQDHIEITGLTFRFVNVPYRPQDPDLPGWEDYDIHTRIALEPLDEPAAIILGGDTSHIRIANNRFEHLPCGIKGKAWRTPNVEPTPVFPALPGKQADEFGEFEITDNDFQHLDHEAVTLRGAQHRESASRQAPPLGRVRILRNRMHHISQRPKQSKNSPAIFLGSGVTLAEIAGNEIVDCYGMGIYTVGGKGGGDERTMGLIRVLIYNNRTDYVMTSANDWGQIAAWQGGPNYVFNNVASNATGYKNHVFRDWDKKGPLPRYISNAYTYYGDGTYKSYWFNNVAWSDYNAKTSKYRTQSPFMFVLGFQNYVFNNSAWNMNAGANGSIGNRGGYLGNILSHMNRRLIAAGSRGDISVAGGGQEAVELNMGAVSTVAFTRNLLADTLGVEQEADLGVGTWRDNTWEKKLKALDQAKPLVGDVGVVVENEPFRDVEGHDFRPERPVAGSARGVKLFVPWGLYATVGEWQFRHNPKIDPRVILGEHFYMSDEYVTRQMYYEVPRGDLIAPNASAESFVPGPLTDWVDRGAMRFNGKDAYAVLTHDRLTADYETSYGFYDRKGGDGEVTRSSGTPLRTLRDELARLEDLLAKRGIRNVEKLKRDIDRTRERIEGMRSRGKDTSGLREKLKEMEQTLAHGDQKKMASLRKSIDRQKQAIAKKEAEGLPDRFIYPGQKRKTLHIDTGNLLIEAYLRTDPGHADGVVAGKMGSSGYQLAIDSTGKPALRLSAGDRKEAHAANVSVNDGKWHHVLAEIDRATGRVSLYVDGKAAGEHRSNLPAGASLANESDFLVGKGNDGRYFAGEMDFLRVCRGTLADARTTIEELYAWQFDGPFLKDFTGRRRDFDQTAPGAIDYDTDTSSGK